MLFKLKKRKKKERQEKKIGPHLQLNITARNSWVKIYVFTRDNAGIRAIVKRNKCRNIVENNSVAFYIIETELFSLFSRNKINTRIYTFTCKKNSLQISTRLIHSSNLSLHKREKKKRASSPL